MKTEDLGLRVLEEGFWDFGFLFSQLRECEKCGNVLEVLVYPEDLLLCQVYVFEDTLKVYREKIQRGEDIGHLTVLLHQGRKVLLDGNHRLVAHILVKGLETPIPVKVYCGGGNIQV